MSDDRVGGRSLSARRLLPQKGIPFCGECNAFPCSDMAAFYAESDGHRAAYRRMCALRNSPKTK